MTHTVSIFLTDVNNKLYVPPNTGFQPISTVPFFYYPYYTKKSFSTGPVRVGRPCVKEKGQSLKIPFFALILVKVINIHLKNGKCSWIKRPESHTFFRIRPNKKVLFNNVTTTNLKIWCKRKWKQEIRALDPMKEITLQYNEDSIWAIRESHTNLYHYKSKLFQYGFYGL